jgi:hypothetical protein
MRNIADVTGGKPIAVSSQSITGVNAVGHLVTFSTSLEERETCYPFYYPGHRTGPYHIIIYTCVDMKGKITPCQYGMVLKRIHKLLVTVRTYTAIKKYKDLS